jgi:pimeloyl-ACP methyl ester carboxylesterase
VGRPICHFAEQCRTIRLDLSGFGRSTMPASQFSNHGDVAELLDFLQVDQAIVVGISYGGKIALDFALANPQRVTALVLGAPSVGGSQPSERIIQFWEEEETAIEQRDWDTAVELNLRLWVDGPSRQPL